MKMHDQMMNSPFAPRAYYPTPTVYETGPNGIFRGMDVGSKLFEESRIIFLTGPFNDDMAQSVVQQLLYLEHRKKNEEISLYINSPGGIVTSGLAIYDTMQFISSPVSTFVMGIAASMGSFILMAGAKGGRHALPNAKIMIHQPSGGFQGQASDIEIHARDILETRARLNKIYAHHTGKDIAVIEAAMERDNYMTPEEALEFGLIDKIATNHVAL